MDPATSQRALVHIKNLLKAVECHVCSSTLMTPLVGRCGHGACARCWARFPQCCPLCALTAGRQEVRPHLPLATRATAVLKLAGAFQKFTGVEVAVSSPSSGTINFIKDEDSEDWFYQKDKKLPKKTYEKKNRESTISNLQSASQVEASIIFPGEAIDTSLRSNDKSGKPDAVDKVKGWLECTQNVFSEEELPTASHGKLPPQVVGDIHNSSYEKFFTEQHVEHSKSQPDWDEIQVISSEPIHEVKDNSSEPIVRVEDVSSVSMEECNSSKEHNIKKDDSLLKKFFTNALNKGERNVEEQEHGIKNIVKDKNPWQNVKKMKKDLKKPSRPLFKKLNTSVDTKPIVPAKSSQISDTCEGSPVIEVAKTQVKDGVADPIRSPEFVVRCAASLESTIPSPICLDSPQELLPREDKDYLACQQVVIDSAMYQDMRPADSSSSKSEADSSKNISEIPLTHFSPNGKNDVSKVKRIVEKIEKKIIVSDILKDFTDDNLSECSSMQRSVKSVKTDSFSKTIEVVPDSEAQRETSYDFNAVNCDDCVLHNIGEETRSKPAIESDIEILHSDYKETTAAPFVYRGRSNSHAQNRKVPFYYKSKCNPNISCTEQQDGLNIEITRDNIVTTIVIRNHPVVHLSGDSRCHVKVAKTRDAQTSPIPFAQLDENPLPRVESDDELFAEENEIVSQNKISFNMRKSGNMDSQSDKICLDSRSIQNNPINGAGDRCVPKPKVVISTDTYEITASLENEMRENYSLECDPKFPVRVASKVIPSTCSKITSKKCSIRPLNDSVKQPVTSQSEQLASSHVDSQNQSLPLQVTIPDVHNSLSFKKRKYLLDEDDKIADDSDPKKVRTKDNDGVLDEDLIISYVDDSQTQESLKEQPAGVAGPDSEPMNYDEIIGTVFANIDKDLQLAKGSQKAGMKPIKNCTQALGKSNTIKSPTSITHKAELSREERDNFSHTRKGDVTDLRNLSMDIETDVKYSENMFNTIYEKNTFGFSSQTSQIDNALPKNSSQIVEKGEPGKSSGARPEVVSKGLQERTIELSPEEQMLLTPTNKVGESMLMHPSEDVFTPQIDKMDSDDVVEDTPQKPRKVTILKKGQDKTNKLSSSLRRSSQSENANVSDVVPLELTQIEKPPSSENLLTKNLGTAEKVNFASLKKNETPLSITKFNNDVKFRSTPMQAPARRSLNYMDAMSKISEDDEKAQIDVDDNEIQSISERCNISRQNTAHSNSCGEKEFLEQAFEISANDLNKKSRSGRESAIIGFTSKDSMIRGNSSQVKLLSKQVSKPATSPRTKSPPVCIATSCLVKDQIKTVKELVTNMGWKFTDQYSPSLTHLVVKVDENNISQRTVKYVQALADGKWIISYNWIVECAEKNTHVKEEDYEVLDTSGGMGPRISRTSTTKLFKGISFYLVAPLTTLKENEVMGILKATGGTVVDNIKQIEVRDAKKVLVLLADAMNSQDDRFFDVCMKHPVVPLNVEWVLDSLGQGRLEGAAGYLLVPRGLLPAVDWPFSLASEESMDEGNS